jgi:hypothetical protein
MGEIIELSKFRPQDEITREEKHGLLLARALKNLNHRIDKVIESSLLIELNIVALKGEYGAWDSFRDGLPDGLEQEIGEGIRRIQDTQVGVLREYASDLSNLLGRFLGKAGVTDGRRG